MIPGEVGNCTSEYLVLHLEPAFYASHLVVPRPGIRAGGSPKVRTLLQFPESSRVELPDVVSGCKQKPGGPLGEGGKEICCDRGDEGS